MSRAARFYRHFMKTTRGIPNALKLVMGGFGLISVVASAALSNTVVETTLDSVAFVASELGNAGTVIDFEASGIATATNSTDTLTIKVKLGSTVIVATSAVDVANNHIWYIRGRLTIRTAGSGGTMVASGVQILGASGTAPVTWKLAETAVDTTGALTLAVTGTWSVANAGNSCRNDQFTVSVHG